MRKVVVFILIVLFAVVSRPVFCAPGGKKGASSQAYEHASDQSIFNRISDWFSTIGKTEKEKNKILKGLKKERKAEKLQREIKERKAEKKAKKEARKAQKKKQKAERKAQQKNKGSDKGKKW